MSNVHHQPVHSLVTIRNPRDEPDYLSGGSLLYVGAHLPVLRPAENKQEGKGMKIRRGRE